MTGGPPLRAEGDDRLLAVLEEARRRGLLGPGRISDHVAHSRAYADAGGLDRRGLRALDLGSGAGVPGLVLASRLPWSTWVLLDSSERRTRFLTEAVADMGLEDRVQVVTGRAEAVGRDPAHRRGYDAVVARSFGKPAVVAECAAPLLVDGGLLIVSEPPAIEAGADAGRWPVEGIVQLGLRMAAITRAAPRLAVLRLAERCPERFPRRVGIPGKRPLW